MSLEERMLRLEQKLENIEALLLQQSQQSALDRKDIVSIVVTAVSQLRELNDLADDGRYLASLPVEEVKRRQREKLQRGRKLSTRKSK